jgi:hypothetical protein
MSDEKRPMVPTPYTAGGECWMCERSTPQFYEVPDPSHDIWLLVCGWCAWKIQWIADHASALAPTWPAPDEENAP